MTTDIDPNDANVFGALFDKARDSDDMFMETADGRQVSFGDVAWITARYARLLATMGVGKGRLIAGVLEKSPEGILLYLAACRLGAIYLPIHIGLTDSEIAHIIRDAEPVLVVCDPARRPAVEAMGARQTLTLGADATGSLETGSRGLRGLAELTPVSAGDPNAMVYTSGTTGKPKGALISAGAVIWNARALATCWRIGADDILLHANPMAFGLFGTTTPAMAGGASMILLPKFDVDTVIAHLPRATCFSGVPTYYSRLMADPRFDRELCSGMRLMVTGSAPMRGDAFEAFAGRSGHRLLDRYGLTEALIATSNRMDAHRRADTSGLPLPGSRLRIVDGDGRELPPGEVGMIELLQPYPFLGYWRDPTKTRGAFRDGWFITGDFGRVDEEGNVSVLGRGSDLIITGGLNVYPKEIEIELNSLAGVAESAVIGVPHPDFGEAVVAVIQLDGPTAAFDADTALAELRALLSGYKVPKRIEILPELPRNTLGKVLKGELRRRFSDSFTSVARS
jgi:malonyl-CoA/methylmalonyl-CoA synthetase